jgi:hypothetical protein
MAALCLGYRRYISRQGNIKKSPLHGAEGLFISIYQLVLD